MKRYELRGLVEPLLNVARADELGMPPSLALLKVCAADLANSFANFFVLKGHKVGRIEVKPVAGSKMLIRFLL